MYRYNVSETRLGLRPRRSFVLGAVVGVVRLDAEQPGLDHLVDEVVNGCHARVSQNWNGAESANAGDYLCRRCTLLRDVERLVTADQRLKGVRDSVCVAGSDQRAGNVTAADCSAVREREYVVEFDVVARGLQRRDHRLGARGARRSKTEQLRIELSACGVDEVREDVGVSASRNGRQLDGGNQDDAYSPRGRRALGETFDRVVVGNREDVDAVLGSALHEL